MLMLLFLMVRRVVNSDRHRLSMTSFGRRLLIIYFPAVAKSADERASQPALFPSAVEFSKDLLLSTCLQTPNIWTCSLLPLWVLFDFDWYSGDGCSFQWQVCVLCGHVICRLLCMRVCVCVHALRTVSPDKILCWYEYFYYIDVLYWSISPWCWVWYWA